jgi:mevalonate kinase
VLFLSGEHSVVFGHPAIYLPLPMRLYIKLEASSQIEGIIIEDFKCPNPREPINILSTELIDDYGRCSTDDQKKL